MTQVNRNRWVAKIAAPSVAPSSSEPISIDASSIEAPSIAPGPGGGGWSGGGLVEKLNLKEDQLKVIAVPTAVLVFHGVGKEVRFETLSRVASFILTEAQDRGATNVSVVVRSVPNDAQMSGLTVRSELSWTDADGTERVVHVYEVYWAPLTAGKVSYLETMGFLVSAGINGLRGSIQSGKGRLFRRWLFGGFKDLHATRGTLGLLVLLMLMVGCIAAGIAIAASTVAGLAKQLGADNSASVYKVFDFIYGQIATPWNLFAGFVKDYVHVGIFSFVPHLSGDHCWQAVAVFVTWLLIVVGGLWFRSILTAYAGSLVAYLSPYKDSKWEELRSNIQAVGLKAAAVVYDGHEYSDWIPEYERIVFVAHSLGSVIGYDTLNAMINLRGAKLPAGVANPVVQRTCAFITLGSPLDKTAFLFRVQLNLNDNELDDEGLLRETMVSAVQPLISDYSYRFIATRTPPGPKWINIWSHWDIISGHLDYYDDPAKPADAPERVVNLIDPQARIPLAAHNQYWANQLLRKTVYDQLF